MARRDDQLVRAFFPTIPLILVVDIHDLNLYGIPLRWAADQFGRCSAAPNLRHERDLRFGAITKNGDSTFSNAEIAPGMQNSVARHLDSPQLAIEIDRRWLIN